MNKEQQIEEIAKDINNTWFVKSNGDICGTNVKLKKTDIKMIAHQLVLEGYRKLPEDSVVLSREEYERLKLELAIEKKRADESYTQKEVEEIIASKERIKSKETAEKILNDFKLWAREYQYKDTVVDENGERPMTNNEKLNYLYTYLCDKYKVEIKE